MGGVFIALFGLEKAGRVKNLSIFTRHYEQIAKITESFESLSNPSESLRDPKQSLAFLNGALWA